jgi:hypothetical protein
MATRCRTTKVEWLACLDLEPAANAGRLIASDMLIRMRHLNLFLPRYLNATSKF